MKKHLFLLFALLLSVTMFAQQTRLIPQGDKPLFERATPVNGDELLKYEEPNRAPGDVVFFEGFEGTTGSALPTGWTRSTTSVYFWRTGNSATDWGGYSGLGGALGSTRYVGIPYTTTSNTGTWLWTPAVNLTAGTLYSISFYAIVYGYPQDGEYDKLRVCIGQTATAAGMTTTLVEYTDEWIATWTKVTIQHTPTASGNHYLGFFAFTTPGEGWFMTIDNVEIKEPVDNDLEIAATYPYTQVPVFQALQPTLSAKVNNLGMQPQTNVTVDVKLNGNTIGSSSLPTLAAGASANLTVNTGSPAVALGDNPLVYTVSQTEEDEVPDNNTVTLALTGTSSIYAVDGVTNQVNGVGSNTGPITFGNIFEVTSAPCYIRSAVIGFSSSNAGKFYTISLYEMTGETTTAATAIYTSPQANAVQGFVTVAFPHPFFQLAPGKYFLCINQTGTTGTGTDNVAVTYDAHPDRFFYSRAATGALGAIAGQGFGAVAIRMDIVPSTVLVNVTTNITPVGAGIVTGAGTYVQGESVTLTAAAKLGFDFVRWSNGETANPYTFAAATDVTLTAIFKEAMLCDEVQTEVGTVGGSLYPIATLYNYSYVQMLYDADEIGEGTRITSISFEYSATSPLTKNNILVYLGNTDKTAFANNNNWVPFSELDLVFNGTVNLTTGWVTITFDTPFNYSGCNLVVGILNNSGSYVTGNTFNSHPTTVNKMMSAYRDGSSYDPANPGPAGASGFALNRPNTKFEVCSTITCGDLQIGTGTTAVRFYPIDYYYNFSYTQQIFLASEIDLPAGTMINSISFQHVTTADSRNNQTVYLANTTKASFAGTTAAEWVTAGLQVVYNSKPINMSAGTVAAPAWVTITFDMPFEYDGNNLLVAFHNGHGVYGSSTARYLTHSTGTDNRTLYYYSDPTNPNPFAPPAATARATTRNNMIFGACAFGMGVPVDLQAVSVSGPTTVVAWSPANYTVTVKNNGANVVNSFTAKVLTAADEELGSTTVNATLIPGETTQVTVPVTFEPEMVGTTSIKGRVEAFCDAVSGNDATSLLPVGVMSECTGAFVTVGTGTETLQQLPFNFFYNSSMTQSIYLANELGIEQGESISTLIYKYVATTALPAGRPIKVYFAHTALSVFPSSTAASWIPMSEFTLVYEGNAPAIPTTPFDLKLEFPEPFIYQGGNLCIMTERTMLSGYTSNVLAQVTNVGTFRTMHYYSDGTAFNFTQAPNVTTYQNYIANIIMYGDKEFTLNPNNTTQAGVVIRLVPEVIPCGESGTVYFDIPDDCTTLNNVIIGGVNMGAITSYDFPNLNTPLPVIQVQAVRTQYNLVATVTPSNLSYGTISPIGNLPDVCGTRQTFTILPEFGYTVESITYNGVVQNVSSATRTWTTPAPGIYQNSTVQVAFKEAPWKIFVNYTGLGEGIIELVENVGTDNEIRTVIPKEDPYFVLPADEIPYHFVFTPDYGSNLAGVYIDGAFNPMATAIQSYRFPMITSDRTMTVEFGLVDMIVVASSDPNGAISPAGNVPVPYGTTKRFNFTPNTGYIVDQVLINNVPVDYVAGSNYYDYENVVVTNTSIHVTFKKVILYIIATTGNNGSIFPYNPQGTPAYGVPVEYNGTQRFEFTPAEGYKIARVLVDQAPYQPAVETGSYTFYFVTKTHYIHVEYELLTYPITAATNGNGTITDVGTTFVNHGASKEYRFTANAGYEVTNLFIDGASAPFELDNVVNNVKIYKPYTFTNVTAPRTISVITAKETFTITASALEGGSITPAGVITANYGESRTFTFGTYAGHDIDKVEIREQGSNQWVVNAEAALNGSYTFMNIAKSYDIRVSFELRRYQIVAGVVGNGSIYPMGILDVNYGEEVTYEFYPENGYEVAQVLVNNENVGAVLSYTFTEIDADGTIEVIFAPIVGIDNPTMTGISVYSKQNIVYIKNVDLLPIQDVSIMDMYGRVVWQGNVYEVNNTIPLEVANGIYAVRIATNDQFNTTKVLIQR